MGNTLNCGRILVLSQSQDITWAYPVQTWYTTSSAMRLLASTSSADLCGPCFNLRACPVFSAIHWDPFLPLSKGLRERVKVHAGRWTHKLLRLTFCYLHWRVPVCQVPLGAQSCFISFTVCPILIKPVSHVAYLFYSGYWPGLFNTRLECTGDWSLQDVVLTCARFVMKGHPEAFPFIPGLSFPYRATGSLGLGTRILRNR
jgi:hypothetical protein